MTSQPSHHEIESLLAPYALDALDADEAEAVDLHLRECPRCRAAVAEFRDTASHLAGGHAPAPVGVWDAIAAEIDSAGSVDAPVALRSPLRSTGRRRRRRPLVFAVAGGLAAAVVAVVALVGMLVSQGNRLDDMEAALEQRTILSAALAAESDPGARRAELASASGAVVARIVVTSNGTGYLLGDALPALRAGRTYQLWAIVGGERISAGVVGRDPGVVPFSVDVAGDVTALAITDERSGGVVVTENAPVAVGALAET